MPWPGPGRWSPGELGRDDDGSVVGHHQVTGPDVQAADDSRLPLDRADLEALLAERLPFTGAAAAQIAAVVSSVETVVGKHPDDATYRPDVIL